MFGAGGQEDLSGPIDPGKKKGKLVGSRARFTYLPAAVIPTLLCPDGEPIGASNYNRQARPVACIHF